MFKNETKNRMMAFAVVAMFVLSAFGIAFASAADADTPDSYNIYMTTDDTFSYTPDANLENVVFSVDGTAPAGSSYNENGSATNFTTYTFHPTAAGNSSVTIKATHSITNQSVSQIINFKVYAPLAISGSETYNISANTPANSSIGPYTATGMTAANSDIVIESVALTGSDADQKSKFDITNGTLKTAAVLSEGEYTITLKLTDTLGAGANSNENTLVKEKTKAVTVNVQAATTFTLTPDIINTYVGDTGTSSTGKVITLDASHLDNLSSPQYTIAINSVTNGSTADAQAILGGSLTISAVDPTNITLNTSAIDNSDITGENVDHMVISYSVSLSGTSNGVAINVPAQTGTINFYKSLAFTTTPVMNSAHTFTSTGSGLDVIMAINATGANKVKYSWGDGTFSEKDVIAEKNTLVTMDHSYAKEGSYIITITAANDFEESSYITPYTTGSAIFTIDDEPKVLKMTSVKATQTDDSTLLTAVMEVSEGAAPAYKWTYSIDGAEAVEVTAAGTPAWITALDGQKLTFNNAHDDIKGKQVKFTCTASVTFEGNDKADSVSASYTFNAPAAQSILWIVFLVVTVILAALAYFGVFEAYLPGFFGYIPAVIFVILTIALFVYGDFNGIIDAITGKN